MPNVIQLVEQLAAQGVGFRSLAEAIDTTTPTGRLLFHVAGAFSLFERDLISERTNVGLPEAAVRGPRGGETRALTGEKRQALDAMHTSGATPSAIAAIATALGVSRAVFRRAINGA